jgi:T5SS/PEP-CTERM-associated repeat protein
MGTLNIEAGGHVSSMNAYVGGERGSEGTVSVTGSGSKWTISKDCLIGRAGPATLNVLDRAAVSVGNLLAFRWTGNLKLDGGTLDALTIDNTRGGTTDFLAGTLRFGSYLGNLTNAGATVRSRDGVFGMSVDGNYTQGADAKLLIEIAGPPESGLFDVLTVTGPANLAGTLALDFSAYVPPEPATYKFLNAPTIAGTFNSYEVIGLDPSLVSFNIPAGEFTVVPEPTTLALLLAAGVCLLPYARRKRN